MNKKISFERKLILTRWHGMEKSKQASSGYSEAITTRAETLSRGDKEALVGVIYKKLLLYVKF